MEKKTTLKLSALCALSIILSLQTVSAGQMNQEMPPPSNTEQLADEADGEHNFQIAAAKADAAMKKARSVNAEWPKTGQTLRQAMAAVQEQDFDKATQLVELIRIKSEKSYEAGRDFQSAAAKADAAIKKARSVNAEWPETEKTLKQARAAAQNRDFDKATQLVELIRVESEKSYKKATAPKPVPAPAATSK